MPMSPRERRILAEIEGDFTSADRRRAADARAAWGMSARTMLGLVAALGLGLFVVVLFGVLLFDLGPVGLGLLTTGVVTPWLVLASARLSRAHRP